MGSNKRAWSFDGPLPSYVDSEPTEQIAPGFYYDPCRNELLIDVTVHWERDRKLGMQLLRLIPFKWDLIRKEWIYWLSHHNHLVLHLDDLVYEDTDDFPPSEVQHGKEWDEIWEVTEEYGGTRELKIVVHGNVDLDWVEDKLREFPEDTQWMLPESWEDEQINALLILAEDGWEQDPTVEALLHRAKKRGVWVEIATEGGSTYR